MYNTIFGSGAVRAASHYGSDQMMRLWLRNTDQPPLTNYGRTESPYFRHGGIRQECGQAHHIFETMKYNMSFCDSRIYFGLDHDCRPAVTPNNPLQHTHNSIAQGSVVHLEWMCIYLLIQGIDIGIYI
jgi:hypothetical protein